MRAKAASRSRRSRTHSGHSVPRSDPSDVMNEKITRQPMDGKCLVARASRIDAVAGLNGYQVSSGPDGEHLTTRPQRTGSPADSPHPTPSRTIKSPGFRHRRSQAIKRLKRLRGERYGAAPAEAALTR